MYGVFQVFTSSYQQETLRNLGDKNLTVTDPEVSNEEKQLK